MHCDVVVMCQERQKKMVFRLWKRICLHIDCLSSSAAAWWLKDIIKSRCLQIKSNSRRTEGCNLAFVLHNSAVFFWRLSERCLTKARSIQAESLKQFSCRKLCQPEFYIIRLGVAATNLPRSELVLDLKKFFSCFPGDLSSPKIFLCLVKYSSESIDSCERKAKKSLDWFHGILCWDVWWCKEWR